MESRTERYFLKENVIFKAIPCFLIAMKIMFPNNE